MHLNVSSVNLTVDDGIKKIRRMNYKRQLTFVVICFIVIFEDKFFNWGTHVMLDYQITVYSCEPTFYEYYYVRHNTIVKLFGMISIPLNNLWILYWYKVCCVCNLWPSISYLGANHHYVYIRFFFTFYIMSAINFMFNVKPIVWV